MVVVEDRCKPLQWTQSKKDLPGRQGRWALTIQEFDFKIEDVLGCKNVPAELIFFIGAMLIMYM